MRKIVLLALFVGFLIFTGVLTVQWSNGTAVIHYDKDKAKLEASKLIKKAKEIEAKVEDELEDIQTSELPQAPQR